MRSRAAQSKQTADEGSLPTAFLIETPRAKFKIARQELLLPREKPGLRKGESYTGLPSTTWIIVVVGVMQTLPARKEVVEHLRACAVGTWSVSAQGGRKRRVVEVAILGFAKKPVAGQEAQNSIERGFMSLTGSGQVFDGLRLAGFDEVGNAEFGDCADGAAEGCAVQDASELFRFLLGHDFHLECCGTLSRAAAEPQESSVRATK